MRVISIFNSMTNEFGCDLSVLSFFVYLFICFSQGLLQISSFRTILSTA